MTLFDLLFIVAFLAALVTLLCAAVWGLRGRGARALAILRKLGICAAAYLATVAVTSVFWPRTVLQIGDPRCFDDWCIAVDRAGRQPGAGGDSYLVALRLSSTARRISQREKDLVVYLSDDSGGRYDPAPDPSAVPFNVQLGPQESVAATRTFHVPAGAGPLGLVIAHQGGFPIGWFIIGYETWFHKPTIVRLS